MSFLLLGFLLGFSHALEADHLVAIGTLIEKKNSKKSIAFLGISWGIGHALVLLVLCSTFLFFNLTMDPVMGAWLEGLVGIMLIYLGLKIFFKMRKEKIHFHSHKHESQEPHFHAHSHTVAVPHSEDQHEHSHFKKVHLKPLLVGIIHGGGGSAGLLALVLAATQSTSMAILYIILFGVGSILGMSLLTMAVALPFKKNFTNQYNGRLNFLFHPKMDHLYQGVKFCVILLTLGIGVKILLDSGNLVINSLR